MAQTPLEGEIRRRIQMAGPIRSDAAATSSPRPR
jgi:hypothetical protein